MTFLSAYADAYRLQPLRTVAQSVIVFFLAMSGVGMCRAYQDSDRERDDKTRRAASARQTSSAIAAVREWPAIQIVGASGATGSLRTACREWSAINPGTFQYDLTVSKAAIFEDELNSPFGTSLNGFTIEFLDKDEFKVRELTLGWRDLVRNAPDSRGVATLSARGGSLFCGPEVLQYARWNLVYAPLPSILRRTPR